jgi:hypothetical protein
VAGPFLEEFLWILLPKDYSLQTDEVQRHEAPYTIVFYIEEVVSFLVKAAV